MRGRSVSYLQATKLNFQLSCQWGVSLRPWQWSSCCCNCFLDASVVLCCKGLGEEMLDLIF